MIKKIIVFGNQKGGTGKSTLAMHLVVSLLYQGYRVATIDVDAKQGTFTRYIKNREMTKKISPALLTSTHCAVFESENDSVKQKDEENLKTFTESLEKFEDFDYVIVDTPGSDSSLSRIAHSFADVIITPMNESFIDLDLLVRINESGTRNEIVPSVYAEIVWNQKKQKAIRNKGAIDWIVLVNRISPSASKNKQELERVLTALASRLGFRFVKGFKERVIFRELFLSGLTLLDKKFANAATSLAHIAARQELNDLLTSLNITK